MMPFEPPEKKRFPFLVLLVPAGVLLLFGSFLALWQFLTPAERVVPVAYTDFLEEVHEGRVEEIRIHDRTIRYRLRSTDGHGRDARETVGPLPDQRFLDSLKPTNPDVAPPKIMFEK